VRSSSRQGIERIVVTLACRAIAFDARRLRIDRAMRDRISERSYLFTISDIGISRTPRQADRLDDTRGTRSLRTSRTPASGARRNRTDDLLLAKQALSQLSYGPSRRTEDGRQRTECLPASPVICRVIMVGLGRFELPTSRLSSARSNQLSYKPVAR